MRMWSRPCASRGVKDAARMEKRGGGQVSGGMENFQGLGPGMYAWGIDKRHMYVNVCMCASARGLDSTNTATCYICYHRFLSPSA